MHAAHNSIDSRHEVAALGDEELLATLRHLLAEERKLSARWLVHLAEVDVRGLYREHAFGSLFDYCVHALHLSEAEAYLRIRAARLGCQFPRVLLMFATGELHLSAIKLLAPVMTQDNAEDLLGEARFKSKQARAPARTALRETGCLECDPETPSEPTGPRASGRPGRVPVRYGSSFRTCLEHVDCR